MKIRFLTILATMLAVFALPGISDPGESMNFVAPMSGDQEVPVRDTHATGVLVLKLDAEGATLHYKLLVANIENVVAAHIHCGAAGVSGPVGVTLFGGAAGGGRTDGVLAEGDATGPDAGNACGWTDLASVVSALRGGDTYVNVHTNDGVSPTNTGPGDFPGGEIRGQIRELGPS